MLAAKAVGLPVLHPSVTTSSRSPFSTYGHLVDIELGLQSSPPTPTSAEAPDRDEEEEEVATASPLADHTGDVASSNHTPVSVQPTELQSTPPATTIHAETSLSPNPSPSPSLVQGAQTENDGHLEVYAQDAQPANTHMGPGELGPAANDGLGSGWGSQV